MLIKRCIAIFLCLLLLASLAACGTQTPATDPSGDTQASVTDPSDPTDPTNPTDPVDPDDPNPSQTRPLTQDELSAIEEYLKDPANNGFLCSKYTSPKEIDLFEAFYNGAGLQFGTHHWSEGEAEAVLAAIGWQEYFNPPIKIPREAANALLMEKCGLTLADFPEGIRKFHYVEAYDAYYHMHGDTNRVDVTVVRGQIDKDGRYIIYYNNALLTLLKTDSGYRFVSNVSLQKVEEPFLSVLKSLHSFYYVNDSRAMRLHGLGKTIENVAVADLDGDGQIEVAIQWKDADGGILILRKEGSTIYGFNFGFRFMYSLNKDGSYSWNSNAGMTQGVSILQFSGDQYTSKELWRVEYDDSGAATYYLAGKPVSEEEYKAATKNRADEVDWQIWEEEFPKNIAYQRYEIGDGRVTVDGAEQTYKDQWMTFRMPAGWRCTQVDGEDGSYLSFLEPTLDRCSLSFDITGAQYARERTEAEYLQLFSSSGRTDVKIISLTKETLSGWACTKVVYSYTYEGVEYIATRYDNVITGFRLYNFSIIYPAAESQRFSPIFEAIIDSMVLQPV